MIDNNTLYKQIPSVDEIIKHLSTDLVLPRNLIKKIIRKSINDIKKQISDKELTNNINKTLMDLISQRLERNNKPHLNKVSFHEKLDQ